MKVSELTNNGGPTRTPIDTEELKRLAASITPGTWNSSIHGTQVLTGDSWNTICEIRVRKDFSAAQWEDGRGSSHPTANARAIALVPALLLELIERREAEIIRGCCPECHGTGLRDSGGVQPWGEPISVPCDCTPHPAPVTAREAEPVAWQVRYHSRWIMAPSCWTDEDRANWPGEHRALYTHPPQPSVSVAEAVDLLLSDDAKPSMERAVKLVGVDLGSFRAALRALKGGNK